jgi:hypothetical protein
MNLAKLSTELETLSSCERINVRSYTKAYLNLLPLYDLLFPKHVGTILKKDIQGSVEKVLKGNVSPDETVPEMLSNIVKLYGVDECRADRNNPLHGVVWIHRASMFIGAFLRELLTAPDTCTAGKVAYVNTLAEYHTSLLAGMVKLVFRAAPSRSCVLDTIHPNRECAFNLIRRICRSLDDINRRIQGNIDANGVHLTYKV